MIRLREWLWSSGPLVAVAAVVLAAFWLAWQFVTPGPPRVMTIAAATKGSPYYEAAERYRAVLAASGIDVRIVETRGSLDNLTQLRDPARPVDAGFVQGGLSNSAEVPSLVSLGRVSLEPVWLFYTGTEKIERLTALTGKRVMIGPAGSGTEALARRLLAASGVTDQSATLITKELPDYVDALEKGEADAGFLVVAPEARTVKRLFASPSIHLVNLVQASAYAQRFPYLDVVELKEGVVDFARDIPPADTRMLATSTGLIVRNDLHPALASLLTQAAVAVHTPPHLNANGEAGVFQRAGSYPVADDQEFPLSADAARVYKSGAPFLQRYLPFWLATMFDRLVVMLLPILGILLPAMRFAPMLYTWRIRRRLFHWYRELMKVEHLLADETTADEIEAALKQIGRIDRAVDRMAIPLSFANQLYDLRGHIDVARARLMARRNG